MTGTDENMIVVTDKRKTKLVRLIIASGWALTLLTMMGILWASVYLMVFRDYVDLPDILKEWGSLALGFLFGGFANIVKDYISDDD